MARGTIPKSMHNTAWWEEYSGIIDVVGRDIDTMEDVKQKSMQASVKIQIRWEVSTTPEKNLYCSILYLLKLCCTNTVMFLKRWGWREQIIIVRKGSCNAYQLLSTVGMFTR